VTEKTGGEPSPGLARALHRSCPKREDRQSRERVGPSGTALGKFDRSPTGMPIDSYMGVMSRSGRLKFWGGRREEAGVPLCGKASLYIGPAKRTTSGAEKRTWGGMVQRLLQREGLYYIEKRERPTVQLIQVLDRRDSPSVGGGK